MHCTGNRPEKYSNRKIGFSPAIALLLCGFCVGISASANAQIVLPASGDINTIAGDGVGGYSGDGGASTSAELDYPTGVAVDGSGNLYIADTTNNVIRKVTASTGDISTVAGNGTYGYSGDGGPATSAELANPRGVAVDGSGNIYIAYLYNYVIRKVTAATGYISTVAGNGHNNYSGDNGPATSAELYYPIYVAVDGSDNIYITDQYNDVIREVAASSGDIATVVGGGSTCAGATDYIGDGCAPTQCSLVLPLGIATDSSGNLYIADADAEEIRMVSWGTGVISSVAGSFNNYGFSGDGGSAVSAKLDGPLGVAVDTSGNIYITDNGNFRIRKVTAASGDISTIAGTGTNGYTGDGGAATSAELNNPWYLAVDGNENVYLTDNPDFRIRAIGH
jgi:trimeric autotransporter adhesin